MSISFLPIMNIYIYTYFNVPLGFSVSNVTNSSDHTKADPHEQVVDGKDASMIQHNADETQQRREQTNDTCGCNDYRYVVYVSKCMFLYNEKVSTIKNHAFTNNNDISSEIDYTKGINT